VQKAGGLEGIKRAAIAVGSEGGISPDEVKALEEKGLFQPVHFAVNILRCETAALYGIAAVQTEINNRLSDQVRQ
jgi:16S rRNA (uracil1498-N3)-methyltransferase